MVYFGYMNARNRRAFRNVAGRVANGVRAVAREIPRQAGLAASIGVARRFASKLYPKSRAATWWSKKKSTTTPVQRVRKTFTADPTNKVSTAASGGMTKHSLTVRLGSRKGLTRKLVRDSKASTYYHFGAVQPFNNVTFAPINAPAILVGGGAYALLNYNTLGAASVGDYTHIMPLHIYDLTSVNNVNNATVTYSVPAYQMFLTGTCASAGVYPVTSVNFSGLAGRQADGVTEQARWFVENSPNPLTYNNIYPEASCLQEWTQIKMLCYGAKVMSTRFKVQVVQLRDETLGPYEISNSTESSLSTYNTQGDRVAFWQGMVSASHKHPISMSSHMYRRHLKVLKEYDFIIDPTTTIEERADIGHSKHVDIFIPMYRKNNYNSLNQGADSNLVDPDTVPTELGYNECILKPKARIYLIVQATNVKLVNSGATASLDYTPTYDIQIRNKFSQLS